MVMCTAYRAYLGFASILLGVGAVVVGGLDTVDNEWARVAFLVGGCVLVVGGVAYLLFLFLRQCMFPIQHTEAGSMHFRQPTQLLDLDGKIPALLISPSKKLDPTFIIIWLHGNAMTVGDCESMCQGFADTLAACVLVPEYPGYGIYKAQHPHSTPSVGNVNAVARTSYTYATTTLGYASEKVVVVGHSIGCGPASHLAGSQRVGGVVLISPYTSMASVVARVVSFYTCAALGKAVGLLVTPCANWSPCQSLKKSDCPILLLHGALDSLIVYQHSLTILDELVKEDVSKQVTLNKLMRFGRVWVRISSGADHVDWSGGPDILMPVATFVREGAGLEDVSPTTRGNGTSMQISFQHSERSVTDDDSSV